jgi:hypothetical protein
MLTGLPNRMVHARQAKEGLALQLPQAGVRVYQSSAEPVAVTAGGEYERQGQAQLWQVGWRIAQFAQAKEWRGMMFGT